MDTTRTSAMPTIKIVRKVRKYSVCREKLGRSTVGVAFSSSCYTEWGGGRRGERVGGDGGEIGLRECSFFLLRRRRRRRVTCTGSVGTRVVAFTRCSSITRSFNFTPVNLRKDTASISLRIDVYWLASGSEFLLAYRSEISETSEKRERKNAARGQPRARSSLGR